MHCCVSTSLFLWLIIHLSLPFSEKLWSAVCNPTYPFTFLFQECFRINSRSLAFSFRQPKSLASRLSMTSRNFTKFGSYPNHSDFKTLATQPSSDSVQCLLHGTTLTPNTTPLSIKLKSELGAFTLTTPVSVIPIWCSDCHISLQFSMIYWLSKYTYGTVQN